MNEALEANAEADEVFRKAYGGDYPDRAGVLNNRGELLLHLGRIDDARAMFEQSLTLFEARLGPGTVATGVVRLGLSEVERAAGNFEQALAHANAALAIFQTKLGPGHVRVARGHVMIAEAQLASDEAALARSHMDAALAIGSPKRPEAQLWTLLHADATLRDPGATAAQREAVRVAVDRERAAWIDGAPTSAHAGEVLARIDALTPTE